MLLDILIPSGHGMVGVVNVRISAVTCHVACKRDSTVLLIGRYASCSFV
jgi:hypothetical protein